MARIENTEALRNLLGTPSELVRQKIHARLNARAIEFIGKSPMLMLSTADAQGNATVSPKGDPAGFVHVEDDRTLLIPERKGNRLIFSLTNILANPAVGLIFLVPGTCETLRVQGTAELLDDAQLCDKVHARGAKALLVIRVRVTECYFHCAKAFLRGELWKPETWPEKMAISFGEEIAESGGLEHEAIAEFDRGVAGRYKTDL
ncbi:MAG TPA: MSMEG_1061 family FMN-dependent PPOX-type flavoprotein [Burkholderiales bacterium]|nr:MSMEG_1061 family FMN-dependent PPOX-type flavoprotein [Burkholderiales bacterium]